MRSLSWLAGFWMPGAVAFLLLLGLVGVPFTFLGAIAIGLARILFESFREIRAHRYALDYVALVALSVSLIANEYLAGALVALMFTGGKALEDFASRKAYAALKSLSETIPKAAAVERNGSFIEVALQEIQNGERILVKQGELVPLDGILCAPAVGSFDFANLTGEAGVRDMKEGTFIKSGAVNKGETITLQVVGTFASSTYHRIAQLVEDAKKHPARIVRMSARANIYFTIVTFVLACVAFVLGDGITRSLAVLVIATPCPLIIAAPVAFIGGMSRLARSGIIVRVPAALEGIAQSDTVFFDKTGTLTLGEPALVQIEVCDRSMTEETVMQTAAGIEIHSLHPLARAIVKETERRNIPYTIADVVTEKIGRGISGIVDGETYTIRGSDEEYRGITLALYRGETLCARLHFRDVLKEGALDFVQGLKREGVRAEIITGDTQENADEFFSSTALVVHAGASPEDKYRLIEEAHARRAVVTMIGDGLNDAPALARADVGVVYSGTENSAAIEAADIAMLDRHIDRIRELFSVSRTTVSIARQSIYGGIALSTIGMVFAALGYIPPVFGALIQETIDIIVILNALRVLRV